jgi:hypothetical protein
MFSRKFVPLESLTLAVREIIITLNKQKKGDILGKMKIIDEKSRSSGDTADTETPLEQIHRDEFLEVDQSDSESAVSLLKSFFYRLREAGQQTLELKSAVGQTLLAEELSQKVRLSATLEGLTLRAAQTLPFHPFVIDEFPFRIGRLSDDLLTQNDLMIRDDRPFQLSRHHVTLFQRNGRLGASDRGSRLGAEVDGRRFGGRSHSIGPVFFESDGGILVLGTAESPFRYKVTIEVMKG